MDRPMTWHEYKLQSLEDYAVRVEELIGKGWNVDRAIKHADREFSESREFIEATVSPRV
ncbi:MAG TPA: hypothetical protein VF377_12275 [Acidimicrobiia bacterium]